MTQSINITIHNKGYLLPLFLNRLKTLTCAPYELIFVIDGCTDNSLEIVNNFCQVNPRIKTVVFVLDNVFETKANNFAAMASSGDYIIILQDDVILEEKDWNTRLLSPFQRFNDVFAVTGNTAHNWELNPHSIDKGTNEIRSDRWCDILNHVHHANRNTIPRNIFAVRDCVNRAPLAINRKDLETLGYFDEAYCPQDMDDHDLCLRARAKLGKVVGCYWIDWFSRPEWGATRSEAGITKPWLYEAHHKNTRIFFDRHGAAIQTQKIDNRMIL